MTPKKKVLVDRIREILDLSEVDATDRDLLDCFGNTALAEDIRFAIACGNQGPTFKNSACSSPFQT